MKKFMPMLVILFSFYALALTLWIFTKEIFFLYNFVIIGTSIGLGMGLWPILPKEKKYIGRLISQILVGGYLFFGLGFGLIYIVFGVISPENMQIEGFWFWLLSGAFMASVIHYLVAKIIGPLIFGRGWCGWACWTAGILDLLPWKKNDGRLAKEWESLRYIHFLISLLLVVVVIFLLKHTLLDNAGVVLLKKQDSLGIKVYPNILLIPELWWFIAGNLLYFASGIVLAVLLKDNRAFCKYLCPITAFLKLGSRFSLIKVKALKDGCTKCRVCEKNCPMDIKITEYTGNNKRVGSTECILCQTCFSSCPKDILGLSFGLDMGRGEYLNRKGATETTQ